jgi:sulfate adenylyltransferase subunit 1 (EFTu-like GTPase family)
MEVKDLRPWQDGSDVAAVLASSLCPQCDETDARRFGVQGVIREANSLADKYETLERGMLGLQMELRVIRGEMTRAVKALRSTVEGHARCASCGVLIGPGHVSSEIWRNEPEGDLVCRSCARPN